MHNSPHAGNCVTAVPEHNSGYVSLGPARQHLLAFRDLREQVKILLAGAIHCKNASMCKFEPGSKLAQASYGEEFLFFIRCIKYNGSNNFAPKQN